MRFWERQKAMIETAAPPKEKPVYTTVVQSPQGPVQVTCHDEKIRVCMCGCENFRPVFKVGYFKPPQIGAPLMRLPFEILVCDKCGAEVTPENKCKGDLPPKLELST